jgi:hypothetical protein
MKIFVENLSKDILSVETYFRLINGFRFFVRLFAGSTWVGWFNNNTAAKADQLDLTFEFHSVHQFQSLTIHTVRQPLRQIQVRENSHSPLTMAFASDSILKFTT